ncbi:hypothetical protein HPB49_005468 [Dermacentor silvarum]|uniref:Uncharacterized protein n=1 Tax=Dermacentor silvarum TaxID=543639 RepID=A0ACB8DVM9_DERSI|nr:hypothetical protein HPB49_005468 [Dermacentor silvarum]
MQSCHWARPDTPSEVTKILKLHRKIVHWALKRGTFKDVTHSGCTVSVATSHHNKVVRKYPMQATEKHQKAGLGAECVADNNEKSRMKGRCSLQVPEKTWTDGGAEKGKMEEILAAVGTGHKWGTLGNRLHQ